MPGENVSAMSSVEKTQAAMLRAIPKLPADTGAALRAMLTPQNLSIMAGIIVLWAGSHLVGIGAIVDLILLGAGAIVLGWSVFEGAEELYTFAKTAVSAKSDRDIEQAADHFAKAILILGLAVIQAILLRGQAKPVAANIRMGPVAFKQKPRIALPPAPASGSGLQLSRPSQIPGKFGETDPFGRIKIPRYHPRTAGPLPLETRRTALYHELVHRYLSPKTGPLRKLRAEMRITGYKRIAFLRYLEEALAQGYAMMRIQGLEKGLAAYRFPIENGYVTVSQIFSEGAMIGTIMLGGTRFYVSLKAGKLSTDEVEIKADPQQDVPAPAQSPLSSLQPWQEVGTAWP
ncbi:hypothetical protein [Agrobacterium larrymoorei]|uniref:Uncharacterized protein n=1 Tax=Agrobacterium larrymoorei TaxID=160699 RepID=A0A4D7E1M8_9HYPH|nr:hypothetical protein [Agrobacterium larrymoorei]QCI98380.1 hypothetical protein CFBP5473_10995 [Agrobacterium larrymoorei]